MMFLTSNSTLMQRKILDLAYKIKVKLKNKFLAGASSFKDLLVESRVCIASLDTLFLSNIIRYIIAITDSLATQ